MKEKQLLELIPQIFTQGKDVMVGPGDDCAVLDLGSDKLFLLAVDQLGAGIHYAQETTSPAKIAAKLLHRNISDIAAMGGFPAHALLSISLVPGKDDKWISEFFETLAEQTKKWHISLCGGDISASGGKNDSFSLTITGWVEKEALCLRSGARDGDILFATGCFGDSFSSGHHLDFFPRLDEARFIAGKYTNTMIDVSDGLLLDAARIAESSKIGLVLETEKIPARNNSSIVKMLTEGEDYELVFAVPANKAASLEKGWPFTNTPLTAIGYFAEKLMSGTVQDKSGKMIYESGSCSFHQAGFDHFN